MSRGAAMVWGLGIVALLSGLYWHNYRPHTYRYKMPVEVRTPQGVKSGSAVREVKWIPQPPWLSPNEFSFKQRGEAVAVDLPGAQTLFVLMDVDGHETIRAGFGQGRETDVKKLLDQAASDRNVYAYPPVEMLKAHNLEFPRLVRFRDSADPNSAEILSPDLVASFGAGTSLQRILLQVVEEPMTNEIPDRLPWRKNFPKGKLNGDRFEVLSKPEASAHLSAFSFSTEPEK